MKIKHWLASVPALMMAAMPSAYANSGPQNNPWEGFEEWMCHTFHIFCDKVGGTGGGPVAVPEPAMLGLFTVGILFVGVMMHRRARQQN